VWRPNCADLDITPTKIERVIRVKISKFVSFGFNKLNIISISTDPKFIVKANTPINKNISPNLLIKKAFKAALLAKILVYQKFIRK